MSLIEDARSLIESIEHGCRNSDSRPEEVAAYRLAKAFLAGSGESAKPSAQRVLRVQAHCGDCCFVVFPNGHEKDGYVPHDIGIGGGDDVELEIDIDIDTGKVVGWSDKIRDNILKMQADAESLEDL